MTVHLSSVDLAALRAFAAIEFALLICVIRDRWHRKRFAAATDFAAKGCAWDVLQKARHRSDILAVR